MDKVILLIDQDGPLADFDAAFFNFCESIEADVHEYPCSEHRFATDCIMDPHKKSEARRHVNESNWFRHLPVTPGAVEGINRLADHPDVSDVFICTKPMRDNATVASDKTAWIREHFGQSWCDRLIITPDKGMVRGSVLLDDAPKSAWFTRAEWIPVIYPTSWNQPGSPWSRREGCSNDPRWSWSDPIDELIELAQINKMVMR